VRVNRAVVEHDVTVIVSPVFPHEFECAFWDVRAGVKMGWWGRPPTPTIT